MKQLNYTQQTILERLHQYRFLTVDQMHRMGIAQMHTLYVNIRKLRTHGKKYVDWVDFGNRAVDGRLPRFHFLTKNGAELLADALQLPSDEINYPKGKVPSYKDQAHRVHTVDLHILARSFCEAHEGVEFDYFQAYFEHQGGNNWGDPTKPKRQAVTKIPLVNGKGFIPDCIFHISDPNGKPFLFTGEIYRTHNTKETLRRLKQHLEALKDNTVSKLYNFPRGVPILILFETQGAMNALQKRMALDPDFSRKGQGGKYHYEDYFLFRTLEPAFSTTEDPNTKADIKTIRTELQEAFALNWQTFTGKERGLFR